MSSKFKRGVLHTFIGANTRNKYVAFTAAFPPAVAVKYIVLNLNLIKCKI